MPPPPATAPLATGSPESRGRRPRGGARAGRGAGSPPHVNGVRALCSTARQQPGACSCCTAAAQQLLHSGCTAAAQRQHSSRTAAAALLPVPQRLHEAAQLAVCPPGRAARTLRRTRAEGRPNGPAAASKTAQYASQQAASNKIQTDPQLPASAPLEAASLLQYQP